MLLADAGITYLATRGEDGGAAGPRVGGDLHTVAVVGDAVYLGGHEAVVVSRDGGRAWQPVASLADADTMGWAVTPDAVLVGGHPGLYRSVDHAVTFTKATAAAAVDDVHALGAAAGTVYLASPTAGLMASADGGNTWQVRNPHTGRAFMGTLLVDPADPARLIASDMASGLVKSTGGGRTFTRLGGPPGVMAAAWNPIDIKQIIAVGMDGATRTRDCGTSWQPLTLPAGSNAVSYDSTGATIYASVLDGQQGRLFRSTDSGTTWTPTA